MAKLKTQKSGDLKELTEKFSGAKAVVFTDYRGTTVKDLDKFRRTLRKENIFSKVYKLTLVKKALEANGINAGELNYKTPVIISFSEEDEAAPARVVKGLAKEIKTLSILEGIVDKQHMSKAQVEALGDLPGKDQLRAQFMSVLNGPAAAFARLLDAYAKKKGEGALAATAEAAPAPAPVPEASPVGA